MKQYILLFGLLEIVGVYYEHRLAEQILKPLVTILILKHFIREASELLNNPLNIKCTGLFRKHLVLCLLGDLALLYQHKGDVYL